MPIDPSKFFDSIRVKPKKQSAKQQAQAREAAIRCEWPDCPNKGSHRAPKGRENAREYWHFCLDHVREYNQSYNFFSGMNAEAVARYQKDALTGHRPTWKMGANTSKRGTGNAEGKALQVMGLGPDATLEDVKAKYKALVKQHHPDANGGDRSTEDRLIEIIKAYNYLKTVVRA